MIRIDTVWLATTPLVDALKTAMFRSAVLHADEIPVAMLKPGNKKTHRAYLWAYAPGVFENLKAVVYDFCESRAGEHARTFLGDWSGGLVCDDFSGYKASFGAAITEVGCMAHARRQFFDLHVSNKSEIAQQALAYIGQLYEIEREVIHQRAAAVMSLIQSAKLNGHDPYAYLKDVLARLPTQKNSRIDELLPHNWAPLIT